MESKFSIGEIAKIHNVSVQTLRHYDKIGLLTPSYINKETGYRYYSSKDFVIIDLIKQCKSMGLSLDEIKDIIHNYTSLDSILDIMKKQKDIIDKKINELNTIKNNISFLEKRINESLEEGINVIFIKEYPKREFIKYNNTNRFTVEFEINLSKALADAERKYNNFNKELAFVTSFNDFRRDDKTIYKAMMLSFTDMISIDEKEKFIIPKGKYLTINFDDDYKDTKKYYTKIMNYIRENNIKVKGDFYEIYAMTRVGNDGREKSLGKLQIEVL
ncbi:MULTISPECIES: MerR family transcriptional regulator [Clostridium]|jgi:MerR family transcriptional activator of bmr gene|uniref:MerR family transcriptional regulator n=1 Tax=Clostridium disporicum TaxID=84024 RepID=A0A174BKW6_9CLOT|nr:MULTISPECIES: MerR family transcriptional regulator [Clostridium]MCD2500781.1 MerR family transcriptional regulator [Clostridium sp. NSJ-145]CUO00238.1 MerR family transcriptional regulator [Clostridium disporicum]